MTRYFALLLILALLPGGGASGGEAVDREAVADEVLTVLPFFDAYARISKPNLALAQGLVNPQNATATIEILPDLLRNEKVLDLRRRNAYAGFILNHADIYGFVNPELCLAVAQEVKKLDDPQDAQRHIQAYYLVLRAIRNASQVEKESLIPKVLDLLPFKRGRVNNSILSAISHEFSLSHAIESIDLLIERHADKESFMQQITETREL